MTTPRGGVAFGHCLTHRAVHHGVEIRGGYTIRPGVVRIHLPGTNPGANAVGSIGPSSDYKLLKFISSRNSSLGDVGNFQITSLKDKRDSCIVTSPTLWDTPGSTLCSCLQYKYRMHPLPYK